MYFTCLLSENTSPLRPKLQFWSQVLFYCLIRKKGSWAPCERLISKSRFKQPGRNEPFEIKTTKLVLLILVVSKGKVAPFLSNSV